MRKTKQNFKKNKIIALFFQIVKFGITGLCSTFISLLFYYYFIYLNMNIYLANTLSFLCGTVFGYFVNNFWVFKPKVKKYSTVWKFYIVYISSYLISQGLLFLWVDVLSISNKIAPLINLCFTIPFNFILSRLWIFRDKQITNSINHTFAVCAYKESPYLEKCVLSVINQNKKSNVIIATSTPNEYIDNIAKKYDIPVFINTGKTGIQEDWNFAVSCAKTDFVTVCHHDDYYKEDYYEQIEAVINSPIAKKTLMIHTGYYDVDQNGKESLTKNNIIKRFILWPSRFTMFQSIKFLKKAELSFGNTICCPSCTYNKSLLGENFFNSELTHCCDWDMYYKMAKMKGRVVYIPEKIMAKRYHTDSQTSLDQASGKRYKEDQIMFLKFWPKWVVKLIMKKYVKAYDINK